MSYIVTHGTVPVGIDSGKPTPFDLEQALAHACSLLSEGRLNVFHTGRRRPKHLRRRFARVLQRGENISS
jgi:hypothetical protein